MSSSSSYSDESEKASKTNHRHKIISSPANIDAEQAKDELNRALARFAKKPSSELSKKCATLSRNLIDHYANDIIADVDTAYRKNKEIDMWKVIHATVDSFRKVLPDKVKNEGADKAKLAKQTEMSIAVKNTLLNYIDAAIHFHTQLLVDYENLYEVVFDTAMNWPKGAPSTFSTCLRMDKISIIHPLDNSRTKTLFRSAQRLMLALGDLYRYKFQIDESTNFSQCRLHYYRAGQLDASNGKVWNQLAVVAAYSNKWLDIVFYYLRALSVQYPFPSARESLEVFFNKIRRSAITHECEIRKMMSSTSDGENAKETSIGDEEEKEAELTNALIRELWYLPNEGTSHSTPQTSSSSSDERPSRNDRENKEPKLNEAEIEKERVECLAKILIHNNPQRSQRYALIHTLHTASILITGINAERFAESFSIALDTFVAFATFDQISSINTQNLLQIAFLFLFSTEYQRQGASPAFVLALRQTAFEAVLNMLDRLVKAVLNEFSLISLYLLNGQPSKKLERFLPVVSLLVYWLKSRVVLDFFVSQKEIKHPKCLWTNFAQLATKLYALVETDHLQQVLQCESSEKMDEGEVKIAFPEQVFMSSFYEILPRNVQTFKICEEDIHSFEANDKSVPIALHARLSLILASAYQIATSEDIPFLQFDIDKKCFIGKIMEQMENNEKVNGNVIEASSNKLDSGEKDDAKEHFDPSNLNEDVEDDRELKKRLMETVQQRWLLEVRPRYIVLDTNTLIEYLPHVRALVRTRIDAHGSILIPTITIDELQQLAKGAPLPRASLLSRDQLIRPESRLASLRERAVEAMKYLKEAQEMRTPGVSTVTTKGNVMTKLSFAAQDEQPGEKKINDDRILEAAVNLCASTPGNSRIASSSAFDPQQHYANELKLMRNVVLLTEDRGLAVKAKAAKIPVRSVIAFNRWAGINPLASEFAKK